MKNQNLLKAASLGFGFARSLNFTVQGALLPLVSQISGAQNKRSFKDFGEHIKMALPKAQKLLQTDAENIQNGIYPISVLFDELPLAHYSRIPLLIKDALRANKQRDEKQAHQFDESDYRYVEEAPDYYRRNFHFQDGGYFSEKSAKLYEHQVEILFSGTAQAMRRQIIPPLKKHFSGSDGKGLKILEVASGTGALTRALALAFPEAQIFCVDPSPHYLQYARRRFEDSKRINFIQGYGENLDFKDNTFDAVVSCYLFHELPKDVRESVIKEQHRVLKDGGMMIAADSIQKDDDSELNWALERFPIDFHEPFYKNYTENPLEDMIESVFKVPCEQNIHFLTKVVTTQKS